MRVLLLCLLCLAAPALRAESRAGIVEFGVICDVTVSGRRAAPLTESGALNIIDQARAFDLASTEVPARLGLSFGIRPQAGSQPVPEAQIVVTHPPMGARGVTVQSWSAPLWPERPALNLFTFQHDYELVQGVWTFTVMDGQDVLASQSFTVTPPGGAAAVQNTCFAAEMTS